MIRYLLFSVFMLFITVALSQDKVTLNGYVKDADNGEELIGVTVFIPELNAGAITNAYGFYSITVPKGTYEIQYSSLGYKIQSITKELSGNTANNVELKTEATVIEEVVVTDRPIDENVVSLQMSKNTLDLNRVR